jgi:hypothetical protein
LPKGKLFIGADRVFPPESDYISMKEVDFPGDTEGFDLSVTGRAYERQESDAEADD